MGGKEELLSNVLSRVNRQEKQKSFLVTDKDALQLSWLEDSPELVTLN